MEPVKDGVVQITGGASEWRRITGVEICG